MIPKKIKLYCREFIGFTIYKLSFLFKFNQEHILSIYLHNPSKILFEKILLWLIKNNYKFISITELEYLINNKISKEKSVIITFDDGWNTNLELIECIEKFKVPVTIFIPTEAVIEGNYWWEYASQKGQEQYTNIKGKENFKNLSGNVFAEKIKILKQNYTLNRSCITLNELVKISNNNLITIGSHTVSHPILNKCSPEKQEFELNESKKILEKWFNKKVDYIAYPNGDYNSQTINISKKCGYKLAFTIKPGKINVEQVNPYAIPRYAINDNGGYFENISKIQGSWQKIIGSNNSR